MQKLTSLELIKVVLQFQQSWVPYVTQSLNPNLAGYKKVCSHVVGSNTWLSGYQQEAGITPCESPLFPQHSYWLPGGLYDSSRLEYTKAA
jgi:hypothetical protein